MFDKHRNTKPKGEECQEGKTCDEEKELAIVVLADTIVRVRTMMVKVKNAAVAN